MPAPRKGFSLVAFFPIFAGKQMNNEEIVRNIRLDFAVNNRILLQKHTEANPADDGYRTNRQPSAHLSIRYLYRLSGH